VFDEMLNDMLPVYRHVRLDQLLTHRGQIPAYEQVGEDTLIALNAMEPGAIATRVAFVRRVVGETPQHDPSEPYDYSNAGYTLAAAMAERVTGKTWDRLVSELVFEPLAMTHSGVGWPAGGGHHDGARGHRCADSTGVEPEPLKTTYQLGAVLGPGGDLNASIADLTRYMAFQLDGAMGRATKPPVAPETWARLDNDPDGATPGYGMGWQELPGDSQRPMLFHDGSAGTFYARMLIEPAHDRAVVIVCNAGPPCGRAACEQGLAAVLAWVKARR
jgi:CubicO group peptidase (beta-lactamase class C family)